MSNGSAGTKPHPAIVKEASTWFIEFRAGDVQGKARERFIEWLRRSPENIQAYLEVSGAWAELPTSDPEGKFNIAALIVRARAAGDVVALNGACSFSQIRPSGPKLSILRQPLRRAALSAAASLILALIALGFYGIRYFDGVYSTDVGEQRTVALADGSSIELDARSRIRVDLTDHQRNVALIQGRALFHVAKDRRRPFIVRAGSAQVRAVGTEFDVYRKSNETVVTVVEGRVETTNESGLAGAKAIVVSAGEQLTLQPHTDAKPTVTDASAATAWIYHRLTFEETPLSEVAEQFNRYNRRILQIEDPEVKKLRISGVYSSTDPTSLIAFLRSQPSIEVVETANDVRISHREDH